VTVLDVSIVSGWLPVAVQCLAGIALLLSVAWRRGAWRRQLGWSAVIASAATGVCALVLRTGSIGRGDLSAATYVWAWAFALSWGLAILGWRLGGQWRNVASVVAIVLTLLVTLDTINRQTLSFPTLRRLVSWDPEHVVSTPQLQQIRRQYAVDGVPPSEGAVIRVDIPSPISHFSTREAYVYLPPVWFAKVTPALPTVVLLPGEPGSASDWTGPGEADNAANAFAQRHHGMAPVIVMPDPNGYRTEDSECVNSQFGEAETYLVDDVPAYARKELGASQAPGSLAIGGLSAGGTCAVMLALRHPTVYSTFAAFSGFSSPQYKETSINQTIDTLFYGSRDRYEAHDPLHLLGAGPFAGLAGWFEVGAQDDGPLQAARELEPAAQRAGIATCLLVRPGGHDYEVWRQALVDALPWLSWRLGLTGEPTREPASCRPG
jgi:S-formylglutathione hydrolase FrmB